MLDVGQGEGIVIQTPSGHTTMIDTVGRMEHNVRDPRDSPAQAVRKQIVVPFLLRQAVRHADAIILTDLHGEHRTFCSHADTMALRFRNYLWRSAGIKDFLGFTLHVQTTASTARETDRGSSEAGQSFCVGPSG